MSSVPVRLDRLQVGLGAWVAAVLPTATVAWSGTGFPRKDSNALAVTLRMLSPPSESPLGGASVPVRTLPTALTLTITGSSYYGLGYWGFGYWSAGIAGGINGKAVRLAASGLSWEYEIQVGDTIEDVRDGLFAAIDNTLISATFAKVGTDQISITADALGDLYNVEVSGLASLAVTASALAQVELGEVSSHVEIQTWSTDSTPRGGAAAAMSKLMASRRLYSTSKILSDYGLGIVGVPPRPVDVSALSGPAWESRASVNLFFSQISLAAEAVLPIETVTGTFDVRDAVPDTSIPVSTV